MVFVSISLLKVYFFSAQIINRYVAEPSLCKDFIKGPVTGYGKLTWEFAHAWNFMKLCTLIVLVMTAIIMVYSLVNSIPLANYDVIYDVTMIAKGTPL